MVTHPETYEIIELLEECHTVVIIYTLAIHTVKCCALVRYLKLVVHTRADRGGCAGDIFTAQDCLPNRDF